MRFADRAATDAGLASRKMCKMVALPTVALPAVSESARQQPDESTGKDQAEMTSEETLYERLGGETGTEKLVVRFYARVLADPRLAPFFQNTSMVKLLSMQRDFFGVALGGPQSYSGMDLPRVHAGRGITPQHFNWFIQHLLTTLEEVNVSPSDIQEVVNRISLYKNDITGEAY